VQREAAALGLDARRLGVGGDSAGGNLAAVVALSARDAADLAIAFQLLIYPATDMRRGAASHASNGQGYLLTRETIAYFHDHYIADAAHDMDWRASPLLHPDLSRLPPALVLTAGYDPLRDEALQYAQRLSEAGNRATHINFERQIHGFITMGKVIDEANAAVAMCAAELRRALG
jgi:acetyl esterase